MYVYMNICLNYYGQNRDIEILKRAFNDFIKTDDENKENNDACWHGDNN